MFYAKVMYFFPDTVLRRCLDCITASTKATHWYSTFLKLWQIISRT